MILPICAQSVQIDSLKLNDNLYRIVDYDKLKIKVAIDSVIPIPEIMDMSKADSLVYIGKTYFEYFKKNKNCYLRSVIFDEKVKTVSLNSSTFNINTKFEDLKKLFPTDCSSTRPIKIYGDNLDYYSCGVGIINARGEKTDNKLLFFFSNNKLKRIDLWKP